MVETATAKYRRSVGMSARKGRLAFLRMAHNSIEYQLDEISKAEKWLADHPHPARDRGPDYKRRADCLEWTRRKSSVANNLTVLSKVATETRG